MSNKYLEKVASFSLLRNAFSQGASFVNKSVKPLSKITTNELKDPPFIKGTFKPAKRINAFDNSGLVQKPSLPRGLSSFQTRAPSKL